MAVTQYMNLTLPTVSVTPGPAWAASLNGAFVALDGHDHSPGYGKQIGVAGLSVDGDLSFNGNNATALRTVRLQNLVAPPALGTDVGCLAVSGGDLYYVNATGQQIQLTVGAALNAASLGAIGGDYSTSTASEFYTNASKTFTFWQAANTWANIDAGNVTIRPPGVVSAQGITLKAPAGLGVSYALTLPGALPSSTKIMTLTNAGAIGASYDADGTTLQIVANGLGVKPGSLTTSHLSPTAGVLGSQLAASAGIVSAQLVPQAMAGRWIKRTVFLSSGTLTTDAKTGSAWIRMVGGGGGGGGRPAAAGGAGGGGAGAYLELALSCSASTAYPVTVGGSGAGGAAGSNNGVAGGDTSITVAATTYRAYGGSGGATGGAGGSGGAVTLAGLMLGGAAGQLGGSYHGGTGGATPLGAGGWGADATAATGTAGAAGQGYGAGGGGAFGGSSSWAGGSGVGGVLVVDEFTSG